MSVTELVKRVQQKLQLRLKEISLLRKQTESQSRMIESLKQQQQELQNTIETLQQQNSILKAAAGGMNEQDKKQLEQTINKYLKDIDKCMALLSE